MATCIKCLWWHVTKYCLETAHVNMCELSIMVCLCRKSRMKLGSGGMHCGPCVHITEGWELVSKLPWTVSVRLVLGEGHILVTP